MALVPTAIVKAWRRLAWRILGDVPDPAWRGQTPIVRYARYDPEIQARALARARPGRPSGARRG